MAFQDFPEAGQGIALLQRSLASRRLGHAYLFSGPDLLELEALARTLAKVLNCQSPARSAERGGQGDARAPAVDCCDACPACQKIDHESHGDVHWVRPESKLRQVRIEQVRELMREVNLKPTEAAHKVGVIVAADRMNEKAANAFLKTLEEPPANSVLVLLSNEPQRLLETIVSRCLRLNFGGDAVRRLPPELVEWVRRFGERAAAAQRGVLGRYLLLDVLAARLTEIKAEVERTLTERSPLTRYAEQEIEPQIRDQWEKELNAAIEAEYRRRRLEVILALQWWCRDVWLRVQRMEEGLLHFPEFGATHSVAARLSAEAARENLRVLERLQATLHTNVHEALALEVALLRLEL